MRRDDGTAARPRLTEVDATAWRAWIPPSTCSVEVTLRRNEKQIWRRWGKEKIERNTGKVKAEAVEAQQARARIKRIESFICSFDYPNGPFGGSGRRIAAATRWLARVMSLCFYSFDIDLITCAPIT